MDGLSGVDFDGWILEMEGMGGLLGYLDGGEVVFRAFFWRPCTGYTQVTGKMAFCTGWRNELAVVSKWLLFTISECANKIAFRNLLHIPHR